MNKHTLCFGQHRLLSCFSVCRKIHVPADSNVAVHSLQHNPGLSPQLLLCAIPSFSQVLGPSIKRQALCAALGMDNVATVKGLISMLNRYFSREAVETALVQATQLVGEDQAEKEAAATAAAERHKAIVEAAVAAAVTAAGENETPAE